MKILFCGWLICLSFVSASQSLLPQGGSAYQKLTGYSRLHHDVFSFTSNTAALAAHEKFTAGIFAQRRFLLKELGYFSAGAVLPQQGGSFGLLLNYSGYADYNEAVLSLAYARKFAEAFSAGVQFNYHHFQISGYGQASALNFNAGFLLHISKQLHTGMQVYNPTRSRLSSKVEERLPLAMAAGLGYDVSPKFFIGAEVEKLERRPLAVQVGLQYVADDKFFLRAGMGSGSSSFFLGLGFQLNHLRIDVSGSVHPQLGLTPAMLMIYPPKN